MSSKDIFLGVFVGFATGVIFGAMWNSKRGNNMRREILIKGDLLATKIMDNFFGLLGDNQGKLESAGKQENQIDQETNELKLEKDKALIKQ